jgi:hypothetical protein
VTPATQLRSAMRSRELLRFERPFEAGFVTGYVVDVGPEFFLTAIVCDHIRFNGFQAFRLVDVRGLKVAPFASFIGAALRKRRELKPRKPKVSVRTLRALLLSGAKSFPLTTIHREKVDADICHIGRVVRVANGKVSVLEIGPDAVWDEAPTEYALKQITRVDFGGDYEDALHVVGGEPTAG